jgi:hypothetical protein
MILRSTSLFIPYICDSIACPVQLLTMLAILKALAKSALLYFPLVFVLVRCEGWIIGAIADGYRQLPVKCVS